MPRFRVSLVYDYPTPAGLRDTAQTDEPYKRGALFYAQFGRATVTKCNRIAEPGAFPVAADRPFAEIWAHTMRHAKR